MINLNYEPLLEPSVLYEYITQHDIDLIEQVKSYAHRYINSFKSMHDKKDITDDWPNVSYVWGFSFDLARKQGKVRVNKMYPVVNKKVNDGNVYHKESKKLLESWDIIKGKSHLLNTAYVDLRETFMVVGTDKYWLTIHNDVTGQFLFSVIERKGITLTQINEALRATAKVDNHGFTS